MEMQKKTKAIQDGQQTIFDLKQAEDWQEEWKGMPEFNQNDVASRYRIIVHFATEADVRKFEKLVGQKINLSASNITKSIWYPPAQIGRIAGRVYKSKRKE